MKAIVFHLEGLRKEGLSIPEPTTLCQYVEASLCVYICFFIAFALFDFRDW